MAHTNYDAKINPSLSKMVMEMNGSKMALYVICSIARSKLMERS
jgi:hypothetical protein